MSGIQKQHQKQERKASAKTKITEQKASQHLDAMQMMEAPETLRSEDVLAAQQKVGNQVVQRTLSKGKQDASTTDEQGNLRPELASTIQQKRGGGEALPEGVRKEAQKVLGKEFKNVRIHTDSTSDQLSRSVSARAFTIGSDIFFKSGVFAPGTSKGRETLMHELTHVVQQSGSSKSLGGKLKLGAPGTAMEKEADHIGKKHAQTTIGVAASATGTVQKASLEDEELLQGAPEEEDELQMQPDTGIVVQRVEDEELLQGQPEEEEMQMQPDAGAVVQRVKEDDALEGGRLNYRKYSKIVLGGHKVAPGIAKQVEMFGGSKSGSSDPASQSDPSESTPKPHQWKAGVISDTPKVTPPPQSATPKSQQWKAGVISDTPKVTPPPQSATPKPHQWKAGVISDTPKVTPPPQSATPKPHQWKAGVIPDTPKVTPPPQSATPKPHQWKAGVIPKSTIPEAPELPKPKETASDGPLSFSDQIKAKSKSMNSNSQRDNLAKLEQDRMQKTGSRVSEQYMEDQANKPKSKWQKFKGFTKKAGSSALGFGKLAGMAAIGKIGSGIKSNLTQAKEQFFGKSEKEEEAKPSPVTVNVSGGRGGGGGGGGMAETISDLFQENKKLKAQIAELEKEKA